MEYSASAAVGAPEWSSTSASTRFHSGTSKTHVLSSSSCWRICCEAAKKRNCFSLPVASANSNSVRGPIDGAEEDFDPCAELDKGERAN